jgi:hypothetical protein
MMFSEPVIKQLRECVQIAVSEPSGDTADSLLHALDILLGAEYLYCDGGVPYCCGDYEQQGVVLWE